MIKIAILVIKAEELVSTKPMFGFINDIVDVGIADPDSIKISVINNNTFFFSSFHIPFYNNDHEFKVILIYFHYHVFLFDI